MNQSQGSVMIATLGGQPQVVTFALDALLARSADIVIWPGIKFANSISLLRRRIRRN